MNSSDVSRLNLPAGYSYKFDTQTESDADTILRVKEVNSETTAKVRRNLFTR